MKSKHVTYLIFYGFIVLILGVVLWHTGKMMVVKEQMEQYLKDEYGKDFIVTKLHYGWMNVGAPLEIRGVAYPKDDPDLKFEIAKSASDNDPNTKFYAERYLIDYWEKQKRDEIREALTSDLVWTQISVYYEEEVWGRTISISEAEHLFKGRIDLCVSYGMFISFDDYKNQFENLNDLTNGNLTPAQAEKLYPIIKKLQNNQYKDLDLEITILNNQFKKEIEKNLKEYLTRHASYFEDIPTYKKGAVLCQFRIDDINLIKSANDVRKFINLESVYLYQKF